MLIRHRAARGDSVTTPRDSEEGSKDKRGRMTLQVEQGSRTASENRLGLERGFGGTGTEHDKLRPQDTQKSGHGVAL